MKRREPWTAWLVLAVFFTFFLGIIAINCDADEPGKVITSLYTWKLWVFDNEGGTYNRGSDLFGGRVISSMDLRGGLHLGLRGDVSAMTSEIQNPSLWRSLEGYAAVSKPIGLGGDAWTAGPACMAGVVIPVTTEATWASEPTAGCGGRVSFYRSWLYVLAGVNGAADQRAPAAGQPWRWIIAGSIEVERFALVGDFVSGRGGFARVGIAWHVPLPWGAK